MDKFKNFVGEALEEVEGVLGRIFDSVKSRDKLSSLFEKLRSMIGLETRQELDDLKEEVEGVNDERNEGEQTENLGEDIESSLGFEENTILFGDSISVGLGNVVKKLAGVQAKSGIQTQKVLDLITRYGQDLSGKNVVVFAGFNDLVGGSKKVDNMMTNTERMVEEIKRRGGKPILCTLYKVEYSRISNQDIEIYNEKLRQYAKGSGVDLVDCESQSEKFVKTDGLHLTAKSYKDLWSYIRNQSGQV